MRYHVLGVGYFPSEYDMERTEWEHYGISFDFADSITQAAEKLHRQEYICIAIRSSQITHSELSILREVRDLPAIMLPPAYTAAERYVWAHSAPCSTSGLLASMKQQSITMTTACNIISAYPAS